MTAYSGLTALVVTQMDFQNTILHQYRHMYKLWQRIDVVVCGHREFMCTFF